MDSMRAILKEGRTVAVRTVSRPMCLADDWIIIRVMAAGLCRTDLYVATGQIACKDPLVLGHEFAGVVHEIGPAVQGFRLGDRVTAMPVIPCCSCPQCAGGAERVCQRSTMLGVDCHGAFAEFVGVPARMVYRVPDALAFRVAAYSEPVAAALAVLNAGIQAHENGLIYGRNRFSFLIWQVLKAHGFTRMTVYDPALPGQDRPEESAYDFVIETMPTTQTLAEIIRAARPFGTVVLKSRLPRSVGIQLNAAVRKELIFRAVNYGSFPKAIAMLADGQLNVSDLLGPTYHLDEFERAFAEARSDEAAKVFLAPSD